MVFAVLATATGTSLLLVVFSLLYSLLSQTATFSDPGGLGALVLLIMLITSPLIIIVIPLFFS